MTPPPEAPGPVTRLFIGRDGLRALWSVVLFAIVLFAATVVIIGVPGRGVRRRCSATAAG